MKRPYATALPKPLAPGAPAHEAVRCFVGKEVEASPAKGKVTMFIVGRHRPRTLAAYFQFASTLCGTMGPITHVYFGANWSFDAERMKIWENGIRYFLKEGLWCTLDIRPAHVPLISKTGLCRHARFIPMVSVRVADVRGLGNNATLKIDDVGFDATNPGVWCSPLRLAMRPEGFTDWSAYSVDKVIDISTLPGINEEDEGEEDE